MQRPYYATLGVAPDADAATIKKAFRKLAHQHHPDRNAGDQEAEKRFKAINQAYEVLGDPDKRKLYDEFGDEAEKLGFDPEKARAYRQWQSSGGARGFGGGGGGGVDMDELLSQLFGGGRGGFSGFAGGAPRGPRRGRDVEAAITLDLLTALRGGERTIGIDGKDVTVRIPAGVRDGGTLRLRGQGLPGAAGAQAGDLLLQVRVAPDPDLTREGDDLRVVLPVTLGEAILGGTVEVPTLDGAVRVKVPAGAQNGQVLRVRGRGVHPHGRARGDLLVELRVRLPEARDPEAEAAVRTLERGYTGDLREGLRRRLAG